jgi:hypothetical protein
LIISPKGGLMAKDVHIARSVAAAAETDAPMIELADERWAKALGRLGPVADQSRAHQALVGRPLPGRVATPRLGLIRTKRTVRLVKKIFSELDHFR